MGWLILFILSTLGVRAVDQKTLQHSVLQKPVNSKGDDVDLKWHPPLRTSINDMQAVLGGSGTFGFIFTGSETPSTMPYSTYNWCNMPHVRTKEYVKASDDYRLEYVEVIHRHHKRTPYEDNTFPDEPYGWDCDDETLFSYASLKSSENAAPAINRKVYTSPANPFAPKGLKGSCVFPQETAGGLLDSHQHGKDLFEVYHDMLRFLPDELDVDKIGFRVTHNQLTSQVVSQVILGMYPSSNHQAITVYVQPPSIDSLEPVYECPAAKNLYSRYTRTDEDPEWRKHLQDQRTIDLLARLDAVSGINPKDAGWHVWFDHYFDNLSARLCHQKPLPCHVNDPALCVTQDDADSVFRLAEYEYSLIYRDKSKLFDAAVASYGIWMAELARNLRSRMSKSPDQIIYRHNVAHDGSMSRLLSILQVDVMVWPGMGSEVIFELYGKVNDSDWFLRVLWGGQILTSSNPSLGRMDMLPAGVFLAYIDGLVGADAVKVMQLCNTSDDR